MGACQHQISGNEHASPPIYIQLVFRSLPDYRHQVPMQRTFDLVWLDLFEFYVATFHLIDELLRLELLFDAIRRGNIGQVSFVDAFTFLFPSLRLAQRASHNS